MVHLNLQCARCSATKSFIEFQPVVFDSVVLRSDTCAARCREIDCLRRVPREVRKKRGSNGTAH